MKMDYDAIVIGAGIAGLYQLYKLRELGLNVRVFEAGTGVGGTWYDGSEQSANENATLGPVKGWEYLIKWTQGRIWGDEYINQEYWVRYISDRFVAKVGYTELGLEEVEYRHGDLRLKKEIREEK